MRPAAEDNRRTAAANFVHCYSAVERRKRIWYRKTTTTRLPWRLTAIEITQVLRVGLVAVSTTSASTVWPGRGPLARPPRRPVTISDDDVCISTSDDVRRKRRRLSMPRPVRSAQPTHRELALCRASRCGDREAGPGRAGQRRVRSPGDYYYAVASAVGRRVAARSSSSWSSSSVCGLVETKA